MLQVMFPQIMSLINTKISSCKQSVKLTVFPQVKSVRFEFHVDIQDLTVRFHKSRQYEIMCY